jgi:hypothetical protein
MKKTAAAPAVDFAAPQWRFEERVQRTMERHGVSREDAEEVIREVIFAKELPRAKTAALVGRTVEVRALRPGQRFKCVVPDDRGGVSQVLTGALLYASDCRARVELDKAPVTRQFTNKRTGEQVEITGGQFKRTDWGPETLVEVLEGMKDFSLQMPKERIQKSLQLKLKEDTTMAKEKKVKKSKANGAAKRGRAGKYAAEAKIAVLVAENPKRGASAKRFELYDKHKTVGEFLAAKGTTTDLHYDVAKKYISIG